MKIVLIPAWFVVAERIGSHKSATSFSIPNNGPIPIGTDGYINMGTSASPNWEFCDSGSSLFQGTLTGIQLQTWMVLMYLAQEYHNANIEALLSCNPGDEATNDCQ